MIRRISNQIYKKDSILPQTLKCHPISKWSMLINNNSNSIRLQGLPSWRCRRPILKLGKWFLWVKVKKIVKIHWEILLKIFKIHLSLQALRDNLRIIKDRMFLILWQEKYNKLNHQGSKGFLWKEMIVEMATLSKLIWVTSLKLITLKVFNRCKLFLRRLTSHRVACPSSPRGSNNFLINTSLKWTKLNRPLYHQDNWKQMSLICWPSLKPSWILNLAQINLKHM